MGHSVLKCFIFLWPRKAIFVIAQTAFETSLMLILICSLTRMSCICRSDALLYLYEYSYSRTSSSCVREDVLSVLFVPNQVGDCGFGAGKVLVCPRGQTALLFLSDRKKERRLPASLSPSVRMCTASLHNYSIIIHCRFQSATKNNGETLKILPFPMGSTVQFPQPVCSVPL